MCVTVASIVQYGYTVLYKKQKGKTSSVAYSILFNGQIILNHVQHILKEFNFPHVALMRKSLY